MFGSLSIQLMIDMNIMSLSIEDPPADASWFCVVLLMVWSSLSQETSIKGQNGDHLLWWHEESLIHWYHAHNGVNLCVRMCMNMSEWVCERVSEWSSECVCEWVCEWSSEWVCVWVSVWLIEWMSVWVSECVCVAGWLSESCSQSDSARWGCLNHPTSTHTPTGVFYCFMVLKNHITIC